tara:strand:- start:176 stop:403 length:228 start_codon:yes stop_codon:yes gene_type:complete
MSLESKKFKVLSYLKDNKRITPKEAYNKFGTMRLSAIIHRLREEHEIVTHIVEDTDKFGNTVRYADYEYKGEINL